MICIVDENLPRRLVGWLKARGIDAVHVNELGLVGASDTAVWKLAQDRRAIVISRDTDFIDLAQRSTVGGTIRLTVGNCSTPDLFAWLEPRWADCVRRIQDGERVIEV